MALACSRSDCSVPCFCIRPASVASRKWLDAPIRRRDSPGQAAIPRTGSRGASSPLRSRSCARSLPVPLAAISPSLHRPLRGTPRSALCAETDSIVNVFTRRYTRLRLSCGCSGCIPGERSGSTGGWLAKRFTFSTLQLALHNLHKISLKATQYVRSCNVFPCRIFLSGWRNREWKMLPSKTPSKNQRII